MQYPHCDAMVLHAPGECTYCDRHPDWQTLRETWEIAFSGHDPIGDQVQCPAERRRPREIINRWGGNRPAMASSVIRRLAGRLGAELRGIGESLK